MALEHGIGADGTPKPFVNNQLHFESNSEIHPSDESLLHERTDNTNVFYTYSEQNRYTPRTVLIDSEPSVIGKCLSNCPMFNPRNVHLSESGTGAANNWRHGHSYASQHENELTDLIDRELDKCDNLSTFQLFHSVAGGTGSGVGSFLLELLNDRYGRKKMISTFLIFPSNDKTSDVVVQPYNTVLTLKRLIDHSDATFVYDNDSLNALESIMLSPESKIPSAMTSAFERENKLIAYVACGVSNPLRFPSYMYSSYESIISTLVPTPELKFLSSSIAPYADIPGVTHRKNYVSLKESDIILELLSDKCKMNHVSLHPSYIAMMDYIVGDNLNQQEIRKGLLRAQTRVPFVPWTSASIHVVNGRKLTFSKSQGLSGFQISNNSSIPQLFSKIVRQYDLLAKRSAYINLYTETRDPAERAQVLETFEECKQSVMSTIEEYKASTDMSYLADDFLDEDDEMS